MAARRAAAYEAQVNPERPPHPDDPPLEDDVRLPVSTLPPVMRRSTFFDPQVGQAWPSPAAYADIVSRTS
jgi:hypothetical protein